MTDTATTEKRANTPSETSEPTPKAKKPKVSRLEGLQSALRSRERRRDELVEKIQRTEQWEAEAVSSQLEGAPRSRPYGEGEKALRFRGELKTHRQDLEYVENELEALVPIVREEASREREGRVGELRGQLFQLGEAEEVVWSQCGELVDELLDLWESYREVVEERSQAFQTALVSGMLNGVDPDTRRELEHLTRGPVVPANGSIDTFVLRLLDVCLDFDGLDTRDPSGRPADLNRRLPSLLPDKRHRLQRLNVSGGLFELR